MAHRIFAVMLISLSGFMASAQEVCTFDLGKKTYQIEQLDLSEYRDLVASYELYRDPGRLDLEIKFFEVDKETQKLNQEDESGISSDLCFFQSKRSMKFVQCRYSFKDGHLFYYPYLRQGMGKVVKDRMIFRSYRGKNSLVKVTCEKQQEGKK